MRQDTKYFMVLAAVFYLLFLLLTPFGVFNDWIPPQSHTGYYSVTTIDQGDDAGYYAYLRSIFFDGDLDFINELYYAHSEKLTSTGYVPNNSPIGQAILFFPFFLIGHFLGLFFNANGYQFSVDGYSPPYYMSTAIASQTYLFIGIFLLFKMLKKQFNRVIALISTLFIWAGTALLYYTFIRQRMAHAAEFCVSVVFLCYWLKARVSDDYLKHSILGGILGFLCMIRIMNIGFLPFYFVDQLYLSRQAKPIAERWNYKKLLIHFFCFLGFFALALSPQLLCWYKLNGIALPALHVDIAARQALSFPFGQFLPRAFDFFFGLRWGLILSSPVVFIGLIGLFTKDEFLRTIRFPLLVMVLTFFFIIFLWHTSIGDAYGYRYLSPVLPVFGIGLAVVLKKIWHNPAVRLTGILLLFMCVFAQYTLIVQYKVILPYDDPNFSWKALTGATSLFLKDLEWLLRSTNFIHLLLMKNFESWDSIDYIFLLVFPLFQLISIVLVYYAFIFSEKAMAKERFFLKPKFIVSGILLVSIMLVAVVGIMAPSKTAKEITKRKEYLELIQEGDILEREGKLDEALDLFYKASTLLPNMWKPFFKMGGIWDKKKNIPKANSYYSMVLNVIPNQAETLFSLGNNLLSTGKFEEAEHYIKSAMRINPRDKNNYEILAQIYAKTRRLDKAEKMFKAALTLDPFFSNSHINLAILYTLMERPQEATSHLKKGIKLGARGSTIGKLAKHYGLLVE